MSTQAWLELPYIQQAAWDDHFQKNIEFLIRQSTTEEQAETIMQSGDKIIDALTNDELSVPDVYYKALVEYFSEKAEDMTNEEMTKHPINIDPVIKVTPGSKL